MPSRLLREGILDSEAVNELTAPAELFYRRLMSAVDDFGRFDARPSVLRSRLYPLQIDQVREADISRWIAECEKAGLIALYTVAGRQYVLFHKLGEPRAKSSKYPAPPEGIVAIEPQNMPDKGLAAIGPQPENTCAQTRADVPYSDSPTPFAFRLTDAPNSVPEGTECARGRKTGGKSRIPPDFQDVAAYCRERGKGVDPQAWFDWYSANGWKVGKNRMVDWKAAVRTWERSEFRAAKNGTAPAGSLLAGEAWAAVVKVVDRWGDKLWKRWEEPADWWDDRKRKLAAAQREAFDADLAALPPLARQTAENQTWRMLIETTPRSIAFANFTKIFNELSARERAT